MSNPEIDQENHVNSLLKLRSKRNGSPSGLEEQTFEAWNESEVDRIKREYEDKIYETKCKLLRLRSLMANITNVLEGLQSEMMEEVVKM